MSHGSISFNPTMHGTPFAQQSYTMFGPQSYGNDSISEETAKKIATLQVKLNQRLGPEFISQRPGPGGGPKLTYVEGWKIINLANEVFGFNGWSSNIVSMTTDFVDYSEESRKYCVGVSATVRVTLRDGVFHEDVGYGVIENARSKGAALDKCKKEAVTDGLKRALRNFGNVMGNCLYDKSYASEVVKIKVEPVKFNKDELHRRPEFSDVKPNINALSASTSSNLPSSTSTRPHFTNNNVTPSRPSVQPNQNLPKPHTSIPTHMRPPQAGPSNHTASISTTMNQQRPPAQAERQTNLPPIQQPAAVALSSSISGPAPIARQKGEPQPQKIKAEASLGSDDFGFDDDEFLALADLGQPISAETDMGRPIDHEEGLLAMPEADEEMAVVQGAGPGWQGRNRGMQSHGNNDQNATSRAPQTTRSTPPAGPHGNSGSSLSRQAAIAAALQAQGDTSASSSSGGSALPQPRTAPVPNAQSDPPQQRVQHQQNAQEQNQNVDPNPHPTTSGPQEHEPMQPPPLQTQSKGPAIGGFNFPSNLNPAHPCSAQNGKRPSHSSASSTTASGIGTKRPAEAMTTSHSNGGGPHVVAVNTGSFRNQNTSNGRSGIGMGLSAMGGNGGQINHANGQRQVLGNLSVEDLEGGGAKRIKR